MDHVMGIKESPILVSVLADKNHFIYKLVVKDGSNFNVPLKVKA